MKKLSFLFAALFVSALVVTSCGGSKTEQTQDSTNVEQTVAPDTTSAPAAADTTQSVQ